MIDKISEKEEKLIVDEDACVTCGACYGGVAPELFKSDNEGKSKVIKQPEDEKEKERAREAIDTCPSQAISY